MGPSGPGSGCLGQYYSCCQEGSGHRYWAAALLCNPRYVSLFGARPRPYSAIPCLSDSPHPIVQLGRRPQTPIRFPPSSSARPFPPLSSPFPFISWIEAFSRLAFSWRLRILHGSSTFCPSGAASIPFSNRNMGRTCRTSNVLGGIDKIGRLYMDLRPRLP